jgi:hypothetical protein
VVSLWWIAGGNVVFSSQFFGAEKCDTILKFIFAVSGLGTPRRAICLCCRMDERQKNKHLQRQTQIPFGDDNRKATTTADPFGMTNKRTNNGNDEIRGSLRSVAR